MSSVTGFKQQCPSCGGQLTIKNPALIGKKVDCPKCKYRFTVAEPDADGAIEEVDAPEVPAKAPAAKNGPVKPRKDKTPSKPGGKPRSKPRVSRDDDSPDAGGKKSNKKMLILAGVSVLLVVIVGIVIFLSLGDGDSGKKSSSAGRGSTGPGSSEPAKEEESPDTKLAKLVDRATADDAAGAGEARKELAQEMSGDDAVTRDKGLALLQEKAVGGNGQARQVLEEMTKAPNAELKKGADATLKKVDQELARRDEGLRNDPTNMLPNNTQVVFHLPVRRFMDSALGNAVFRSRGAFRQADFEARLGIPIENIETIVLAGIKDHSQSFAVVRTFEAYTWEAVKAALHVKEDTLETVRGKDYYLGKVDFLGEFLEHHLPLASLRTKAAVCRKDDRTLIYGDPKTVAQFLATPPTFNKESLAPPPGSGGPPGGLMPPGGVEGGTPEGEAPPAPGGKGGGGGGIGVNTLPGGGGPLGVGGMGAPAGPGEGSPAAVAATDSKKFLTLKTALRRLIERAENKQDPLLVYAADSAKDIPTALIPYLNQLPPTHASKVQMLALALNQLDPIVLTVVLSCRSKEVAPDVLRELQKLLETAAKGELKDLLGFDLAGPWSSPETEPQDNSGLGPNTGMMPGGRSPATMAPGMGGGGRMPGGGAPRNPGTVPGASGGLGGGGIALPGGPSNTGGLGTTDGGPGIAGGRGAETPSYPGTNEDPGPVRNASRIDISRFDEIITVVLTIVDDTKKFVDSRVAPRVQRLRGEMDMNSGQFRIELLGMAVPRSAPEGFFPRGALLRERKSLRPWPPDQRVSWMRELLPYLGDDRYREYHGAINPNESWRHPLNLAVGSALVPHFLHPQGGAFYTKVRGLDQQLAVTHFVGMAGVGPDAPNYRVDDPRAGILGYDRQTKLDMVKDGLSNTIYLIQTDPALVGPWIAGGGATIRGTSETGDRDVGERGGFSSPNYAGKPGAYVVLADGSVRFLAKGISPTVFKALCTMAGGDGADLGLLDSVAPRVSFKTAAPPPAAKPLVATPAAPAAAPDPNKPLKEEEGKPKKPNP